MVDTKGPEMFDVEATRSLYHPTLLQVCVRGIKRLSATAPAKVSNCLLVTYETEATNSFPSTVFYSCLESFGNFLHHRVT